METARAGMVRLLVEGSSTGVEARRGARRRDSRAVMSGGGWSLRTAAACWTGAGQIRQIASSYHHCGLAGSRARK